MEKMVWTQQQKKAIELTGGTVLVSAAAGSGKTAVLVQRLVHRITDEQNPVDADRFLVVTFSNAAAAQMRQRVLARISRELYERPENLHLRRQRFLLEKAQISTIHAFCLDLIFRDPQKVGIAPDFSLLDEAGIALLEQDALYTTLERFYEQDKTGDFAALVQLLSGGRDDQNVVDTVLQMHRFVRSHAFYRDWMQQKLTLYDPEIPVEKTIWGEVLLAYAHQSVLHALRLNEAIIKKLDSDPLLAPAYGPAVQSDREQLQALLKRIGAADWDGCVSFLREFSFARLGAVRAPEKEQDKAIIQSARAEIKKIIEQLTQKHFCASSADFRDDLEDLRPKVAMLFRLVAEYDETYTALKHERKALDFSDLEHYALALLVQKNGETYQPSELAKTLSYQYEEILIDEYQDTNSAQDMLFWALSREGENLFYVGDVKQSIYRFRQAMPELFIEKLERFAPEEKHTFPAKLFLGKNFRSRHEITDFVNFVFSRLMSKEVGELSYDDEQKLVCAASYPEKEDCHATFAIVGTGESEENDEKLAAEYVAGEILALLKSGKTVQDGEEERPIRPGDICILLRSTKNRAHYYQSALNRAGIHSYSESAEGFLPAKEIATITNFLRVIDNPYRDVALLSVLLSDICAFTPEETARIKLLDKQKPLYHCLRLAAENGEQKAKDFLEQLQILQRQAVSDSVAALLSKIYAITRYPEIVGMMPMGEARKNNLYRLNDYATSFDRQGARGIYAFVRFLDRLEEQKSDLNLAGTAGELTNTVTITSIHKSKGLEYPYVFVSGLQKNFNKQDLRKRTILHPQMGFACMRRDAKLKKEYTTLPLEALRCENEKYLLSEELRILYVALTRAKEKLYLVAACDYQKLLKKTVDSTVDGEITPFAVRSMQSYAQWILACFLSEQNAAGQLADLCAGESFYLKEEASAQLCIKSPVRENPVCETEETPKNTAPDEAFFAKIQEKSNWTYPFEAATRIPRKLGVSDAAKKDLSAQYAFSKTPKFLTGEQFSGAQKGDALHHFMQYANYDACAQDPQKELERLVEKAYLTKRQAEVIPLEKVRRFFASPLYRRMQQSPNLQRELRFLWELDAAEMGYPANGETITVQGVADCVFEENGALVLVDYKTDVVPSSRALAEKYAEQVRLYKMILEQSLQKKVSACVLYSFHLDEEILLDFTQKP